MLGGELDPSVWGRLPGDLHSLLIERLPLRSIARLRAVSKSWNRAWYYLVITNPNSRIKDEEWEESAWFQILSRIPQHRNQVRLSLVCRLWKRYRKNLPALDIMVPSIGKKSALKFIRSALNSRPGLRKLMIFYLGSAERGYKTGILEHQVLALLQPFQMQLEEINLKLFRTRYTRVWRQVAGRFPRLVTLKCSSGRISSPPADRTLANLKHLDFLSMDLDVEALDRICKLCTSLERLGFSNRPITPENMGNTGIMTLESSSLRGLMLSLECIRWAGLVVKMPQLEEFSLYGCKLVHLQGSERLQRVQIPLHSDSMPGEIDHIDSVKSLSFRRDQRATLEPLQRILKAATGLKRLTICSEFDNQQVVTLRELIPPYVELFFCDTNLFLVLDTDGDHWDQVGEEVVLREGRGEEMFSLKRVSFDLTDLERTEVAEKKFISILGQMLRCSPSLEVIALEPEWRLGCLRLFQFKQQDRYVFDTMLESVPATPNPLISQMDSEALKKELRGPRVTSQARKEPGGTCRFGGPVTLRLFSEVESSGQCDTPKGREEFLYSMQQFSL